MAFERGKLVRKLIKRFNLQRSARKREKEGKETRVANYNTPRSNLGEKVPRSIKPLAFTFREIFIGQHTLESIVLYTHRVPRGRFFFVSFLCAISSARSTQIQPADRQEVNTRKAQWRKTIRADVIFFVGNKNQRLVFRLTTRNIPVAFDDTRKCVSENSCLLLRDRYCRRAKFPSTAIFFQITDCFKYISKKVHDIKTRREN